jgi:hypothetical protein
MDPGDERESRPESSPSSLSIEVLSSGVLAAVAERRSVSRRSISSELIFLALSMQKRALMTMKNNESPVR